MNWPTLLDLNALARLPVEDFANHVEHLALSDITHGNRNWCTGVMHNATSDQSIGWFQSNSSNQIVAEVLGQPQQREQLGAAAQEWIDAMLRGDAIVDIGKEFGTVTGRRRRPGWLDLVMLRHAVRLNSLTEFALTKVDVLDDFESIDVCVGYTVDGVALRGYPDDVDVLGRVTPKYVTLPGWKKTLRGCRSYADLPSEAKAFVDLIEREVGVPVSIIGVGPGRDECVVRT